MLPAGNRSSVFQSSDSYCIAWPPFNGFCNLWWRLGDWELGLEHTAAQKSYRNTCVVLVVYIKNWLLLRQSRNCSLHWLLNFAALFTKVYRSLGLILSDLRQSLVPYFPNQHFNIILLSTARYQWVITSLDVIRQTLSFVFYTPAASHPFYSFCMNVFAI